MLHHHDLYNALHMLVPSCTFHLHTRIYMAWCHGKAFSIALWWAIHGSQERDDKHFILDINNRHNTVSFHTVKAHLHVLLSWMPPHKVHLHRNTCFPGIPYYYADYEARTRVLWQHHLHKISCPAGHWEGSTVADTQNFLNCNHPMSSLPHHLYHVTFLFLWPSIFYHNIVRVAHVK